MPWIFLQQQAALDYFFMFGENQIYEIIKTYLDYYNSKRLHQGLHQNIPSGYASQRSGGIPRVLFWVVYVIIIRGKQHDGYNLSAQRVFKPMDSVGRAALVALNSIEKRHLS